MGRVPDWTLASSEYVGKPRKEIGMLRTNKKSLRYWGVTMYQALN